MSITFFTVYPMKELAEEEKYIEILFRSRTFCFESRSMEPFDSRLDWRLWGIGIDAVSFYMLIVVLILQIWILTPNKFVIRIDGSGS
jgi:hypothetical protein